GRRTYSRAREGKPSLGGATGAPCRALGAGVAGMRAQLVRRIILAIALLQLAYQAGFLLKGFDFIVGSLPIDDTYYYLQTAWNVPRAGFVTFDGLHQTCGLQFLWFWLLVGISVAVSSKTAFLYASLLSCVLLNALGHWPIYRIGRTLQRDSLGLALSAFWFNINLTTFRWYV